jgi:TonB family protein
LLGLKREGAAKPGPPPLTKVLVTPVSIRILRAKMALRSGEMAETMNAVAIRGEWVGAFADGRFPLLRWLGGSPGAGVFETEIGEPPRKAIIKLIPAEAEDAQTRLASWAAAANLSHPHLMQVHTHGQCVIEDLPVLYVVTEYADEVLAEILRERPLTTRETRELLAPALEALSYLHGKGLVHGRVRPSNIMAVGDSLKLSSDSVAAAENAANPLAEQTIYDAPEIAGGKMGTAADIWSLGATLVEVLTKYPPVSNRARPFEPLVPESTPEPFGSIARKCLRADPDRRITLDEIKTRLQLGPPPGGLPRQQAKTVSSKQRVAVLLAVATIVLAAIGIWRAFWHHEQTPLEAQPAQTAPPAAPASVPAPAAAGNQPSSAYPAATAEGPPPTPHQASVAATPAPAASGPAPSSAPVQPMGPPPQVHLPLRTAQTPASRGASVKGEVAQQAQPDIPEKALATISGTVKLSVRLEIDADGNVTSASLDTPGPSQYFAGRVLAAAKQWKFTPAQAGGLAVPSTWLLHYQLKRSGVSVLPEETAP